MTASNKKGDQRAQNSQKAQKVLDWVDHQQHGVSSGNSSKCSKTAPSAWIIQFRPVRFELKPLYENQDAQYFTLLLRLTHILNVFIFTLQQLIKDKVEMLEDSQTKDVPNNTPVGVELLHSVTLKLHSVLLRHLLTYPLHYQAHPTSLMSPGLASAIRILSAHHLPVKPFSFLGRRLVTESMEAYG